MPPTQDTIATYDVNAGAYAERWFDLRLKEDMARLTGRLGPGVRVLDVGCGPGRDTAWLREQGFQATGIDLSLGMLQEGITRGVDAPLIQADMAHLPFRKGSFGALWVCASFLHIPKDQAGDVLRELSRVVYPGHIYIAVKEGTGEAWVTGEDGRRRFFAYYDLHEIQLLMERSGFQVLSCWKNHDAAKRKRGWINVLAWSKMETPRTGTGTIVRNEQGEILLTRRADNGYWCMPGGHMDYGETIQTCAVREVYEETGLHVELERMSGLYSRPYKKQGESKAAHYVIVVFVAHPTSGTLALCDETTDVGFFSPDSLPEPLWRRQRERIEDALLEQNAPVIK